MKWQCLQNGLTPWFCGSLARSCGNTGNWKTRTVLHRAQRNPWRPLQNLVYQNWQVQNPWNWVQWRDAHWRKKSIRSCGQRMHAFIAAVPTLDTWRATIPWRRNDQETGAVTDSGRWSQWVYKKDGVVEDLAVGPKTANSEAVLKTSGVTGANTAEIGKTEVGVDTHI